MHRFLSRNDESAGLTAFRDARQKPPQTYCTVRSVSRFIDRVTFAGLAKGDQGARRRRCRDIGNDQRHRGRPQPSSARRVAAGRHQFLCRSSSAIHIGIASSSLRELDAVALATNTILSMKRGTKEAGSTRCGSHGRVPHAANDLVAAVENSCIVREDQACTKLSAPHLQ